MQGMDFGVFFDDLKVIVNGNYLLVVDKFLIVEGEE